MHAVQLGLIPVTVAALLAIGCADTTAPAEPLGAGPLASMRAGLVCVDVDAVGTAPLGIIPAGYEGAGGLGGLPGPFTFGDISGTLHSYLTSGVTPVGANAQGATHITLRHIFTSSDGSFRTDDKAVCAPVPGAPGTCRLSDQMTVAGGDGVFDGAAGKLRNRGVLDFNTFTLSYHLTGRLCGAGL
ncbi:hypothetical protein BH23GEM9_BH23GEM9_27880 [soil metagenome]